MERWLRSVWEVMRSLGWARALGLSAVLFVGSIALAVFIVIRWPVDQFKGDEAPPLWHHRHPIIRLAGLVLKNVAGYAILLLGVGMAIPGVPGQGALLILIGLTLVQFPGKRRLERKLIGRPAVLRAVNRMRARFGHPALELD